MGLLMVSVDMTIVATALATIQRDLDASLSWSGWTITVYSLGQIIAMPVGGRLSDQFGRKKVLLVATSVFSVASLCCGLVDNIYALIAFRAVQALGGGAVVPSATGIVADHFGRNRDRAIGMFSSIFPIGAIIGPVIGGVLITYTSWRAIFFVNVPIGLLVIVLAALLITQASPPQRSRLDVPGTIMLAVLLLSAMYGVTILGVGATLTDPRFAAAEATAAVTLVLFVRHIRRREAPIIPPALLRGRGFAVMHVVNVLFGGVVIGMGALIPLYAELRYGLEPLQAGSMLAARAIGMICVAGFAVLVLRRLGHRIPIIVGFATVSAGLFLMSTTPHGMTAYHWLALTAGITGVGMGVAMPASNNATLHLAPTEISTIAGLRGMFRQTGAIAAISITTAVLARSDQPEIAHAAAFAVFAFLLLATVPLIFTIPDHRGTW
ncbi:MAG: MFS transporter [Propionibacteriales bacterium]|nr:MFS transporter [Propionibacteriales bacterium]